MNITLNMDGAIKEGIERIRGKDKKNGSNLRAMAWNLFLYPLDQDLMLKAVNPEDYKRRKHNYKHNFKRRYRCTECNEELTKKGKVITRRTEWKDKFIKKNKRICPKCKSSKVLIIGRGAYGSAGSGNSISDCFRAWENAKFLTPIESHYLNKPLSMKITYLENKAINYQKNSDFKNASKIRKEIKNIKGDLLQHKSLFQFNLNPFFSFIEMKGNLKSFTKEEKYILERMFLPQTVRNKLFYDYKHTDFLDAIAKFYVREFYIPFIKLKYSKNNKFSKDLLKGIKLSNDKPREQSMDISLIVKNKLTPKEKATMKETDNFIEYVHSEDFEGVLLDFYKSLHKEYPDIMNKLDNKILKLIDLA